LLARQLRARLRRCGVRVASAPSRAPRFAPANSRATAATLRLLLALPVALSRRVLFRRRLCLVGQVAVVGPRCRSPEASSFRCAWARVPAAAMLAVPVALIAATARLRLGHVGRVHRACASFFFAQGHAAAVHNAGPADFPPPAFALPALPPGSPAHRPVTRGNRSRHPRHFLAGQLHAVFDPCRRWSSSARCRLPAWHYEIGFRGDPRREPGRYVAFTFLGDQLRTQFRRQVNELDGQGRFGGRSTAC